MNSPSPLGARRAAAYFFLVLAAIPLRAEDAPARHQMENRFLFVLETSSSMRSRAAGVEQAVIGLLKSGIHGQLRDGDTIGLWTYSDRLRPDFPRQVWSGGSQESIEENISNYLRHLRYEKRGRLDKILPQLSPIIENSERLTIIFIYDGTETLNGTPFDNDVNGLQKKYARRFRDDHLPMVTILAARDGHLFDYTINYPDSINVPQTADPLPPPVTNAPVAPVAATPAPHRHIEIIMSGSASAPPAPLPAPPVVATVRKPTPPASTPPISAAPPVDNISNPPPSAAPPQPLPVAEAVVAPSNPPVETAKVPSAVPVPSSSPVTAATPSPQPETPVLTPAPNPPPPPLAAASTSQQIALYVIAFSLLTIAVVLVIFLVRRARGDAAASLISQSIDRSR